MGKIAEKFVERLGGTDYMGESDDSMGIPLEAYIKKDKFFIGMDDSYALFTKWLLDKYNPHIFTVNPKNEVITMKYMFGGGTGRIIFSVNEPKTMFVLGSNPSDIYVPRFNVGSAKDAISFMINLKKAEKSLDRWLTF